MQNSIGICRGIGETWLGDLQDAQVSEAQAHISEEHGHRRYSSEFAMLGLAL
jgi:hypothetical protein